MAPRHMVGRIRRRRACACASLLAGALGCVDEGYLRPIGPGADAGAALETDAGLTEPQPFGVRSWRRTVGSNAGLDTLHDVAITHEGQVVVAGATRAEVIAGHVLGPPGELKSVVIGLSAATGDERWLLSEPGLGGAIAAHPAGGVVATAAASLVRIDAFGQIEWGHDRAPGAVGALVVGGDGASYAVGAEVVSEEPRVSDVSVSAYDGAGELRWARRFSSGGESVAHALAVAPGGELWIAGTYEGNLDLDGIALALEPGARRAGFVARLAASGEVIAAMPVAGGEAIAIAGIGVGEGGALYAAGTIDLPTGGERRRESFLLRYDEGGEPSWERRLALAGRVHALLVDPDVGVVLAGAGGGDLGGVELEPGARFLARYDEAGSLVGALVDADAGAFYRALAARDGALAAAGQAAIEALACAPEAPRCEIYGLVERFQRIDIE
jgi:hypothetical protein